MSFLTTTPNTVEATDRPWWRTFQATLVVAVVVATCGLVFLCRGVLFYLFTGIVIATAVRSLVARLRRRGLSQAASAAVVYAFMIVAACSILILPIRVAVQQAQRLGSALPAIYASVRGELLQSAGPTLRRFAERTPNDIEALLSGDRWDGIVRSAAGFVSGKEIGEALFAVVAILLLAFYWTLHEERTVRSMLFWVPSRNRDAAKEFIEAVLSKTGAFVRGQALLCLIVGVLNLAAYLIIGVPYPFALALLAGTLEALPLFGPLLGAIPAILVASTLGWQPAVWTAIAALVIQQSENHLLLPRVMSRSVGVNAFVTLLAMAGFAALFGVVGLILAIPLAACFQLVLDRFVLGREAMQGELPEGRDRISRLRFEANELAQDARLRFRESEPAAPDGESSPIDGRPWEETIEALAVDLEKALAEKAADTPTSEGAVVAAASVSNVENVEANGGAASPAIAERPLVRLAIQTLIVVTTLSGLALLMPLGGVLLLFALAWALAAALTPLVDMLRRRGWPRGIALAAAYASTVLLVVGIIAGGARPWSGEVQRLAEDSLTAVDHIKTAQGDVGGVVQALFDDRSAIAAGAAGQSSDLALTQRIFGATAGVMGFAAQLLVVLVVSIYWMVDREYFERLWLSLLSPRRRLTARDAWRHAESEVGSYIRSEVLQMVAAVLLLAIGYRLLGHPYPLTAAACCGILWLVPWAGVVFAIGSIVILALPAAANAGWQDFAWMTIPSAIYAFSVLWWLEFAVEPRLFARRRYNTLGMAVVTLAMAQGMGFFGLLLGPPVAIVAEILLEYALRLSSAPATAVDHDGLATLSTQAAEVVEEISQGPSPPQEVLGLGERLKELVRRAKGAGTP